MNLARFNLLRRNKYLLFWCRLFVSLNALNAIVQLFYLQRGVTMSQIFYLGIAWSLASLMFDIPTSYLADKWGRRNTILLGVIINVFANGYLFWARGFVPFFIDTFIMSVSFSFFLGVEDAFLYDNLKEMKQEGVVLKTSGKYLTAARGATLLAPLLGVLIAKSLSPLAFNLLLLINIISSCVAVVFAFKLVEPKKFEEQRPSQLGALKDGITTFLRDKALRTFALNKTLIFVAGFIFWRFYQNTLYSLGVPVLLLGLLYFFFNIVLILIFSTAHKIFKHGKPWLIFEFPTWVCLISSILFMFTTTKWLACVLSIFILITVSARDPFFNQQIQWRIKSFNRATTGSILGIFKSMSDIPLLFLSGYLASFGGRWVMLLPITLSLTVLIFLRIKKEYVWKELPT
jgi:MFS family permease